MPYIHLTLNERYVIYHLVLYGLSYAEIGRRLGRHKSTISREVRRNNPYPESVYYHENAELWSNERRRNIKRPSKQDNESLWKYVQKALKERWSPEEISNRLKLQYPRSRKLRISYETMVNSDPERNDDHIPLAAAGQGNAV